eukprot:278398-Rhodomonas_salina.2
MIGLSSLLREHLMDHAGDGPSAGAPRALASHAVRHACTNWQDSPVSLSLSGPTVSIPWFRGRFALVANL